LLSTCTGSRADRLLVEVLDELSRARIDHALVRAPSIDGRGQLEADLLVRPDHRLATEDLLARHGFARRPSWGRRPHRFHLRPVRLGTGGTTDLEWLKIDLVTDLAFGRWHELPTNTGARCLGHPDRVGPHRLAPADELLAQLLHRVLDGKGLDEGSRARLRTLCAEVRGPGALAAWATPADDRWPAWSDVLAAVETEDWTAIERMTPSFERRLLADRSGQVARRRLTNQLARRAVKGLTAVRGRGHVVALVGPDGTGKTTLAAGVAHSLAIPTHVLYGGTYRSGTRRSRLPGVATSVVAGRLVATRVQLGWHRTRGRLVVLDRHPIEARPGPQDLVTRRTRMRRRVLAGILPLPDLLIALDAPADLLHQRRPEHDVAQLDDDRRRHLELVARTPRSAVIDASAPADDVLDRTLALVWERVVAPGALAGALAHGSPR
jgi:hypothetical protein